MENWGGLWIGDWPNPQSPIPKHQIEIQNIKFPYILNYLIEKIIKG